MAKKAKPSTIDMSGRDYKRSRVVGADGKVRHSASNDDAVARAMLTFVAGGGDFDKVIAQNKLGDKYPKGAKGFGNPGLFRMSLGGTLRALVRAGTPVKIGSIEVKTLEQRIADPASSAWRFGCAPQPAVAPRAKKAKAAKKAKRKPRAEAVQAAA